MPAFLPTGTSKCSNRGLTHKVASLDDLVEYIEANLTISFFYYIATTARDDIRLRVKFLGLSRLPLNLLGTLSLGPCCYRNIARPPQSRAFPLLTRVSVPERAFDSHI